MSVQIKIDTRAVVDSLTKLAGGLAEATKEGLKQAAEDGFNDSQRLVPVRTGRLKASGGIKQVTEDKVVYGYDAPYAGYVEYGVASRNRPAKPYITPRYNVLADGLAADYVYRRIVTIL